jgi:predicted transcriptional regulator
MAHRPAVEIIDALLNDCRRHLGAEQPPDDVTVVVVRRGKTAGAGIHGMKDSGRASGKIELVSTVQIEVDDELLEKLDRLGPDPSSRRSEFISMAIRKALWELEEKETAAAYARQPDSEDDAYVDPDSWEPS